MQENINYIAYTPLTKKVRFHNAVLLIEEFLTQYKSNYKFKLEDHTTNNYDQFKKDTLKDGYMKVLTKGCEKTIYNDPKFNIIARVWHDNIHLNSDLNFSVEDEKIVAYLQIAGIEEYATNVGYNCITIEDVKEIIYHDIIAQVEYYEKNKIFVDDQKKFVYSKFLNKGGK